MDEEKKRQADQEDVKKEADDKEVTFRGIPEDLVDAILVVEGRELRVNRSVLALHSPVFQKLFFSDFKEKGEQRIPLPEDQYQDMVMFLHLILPGTSASEELISDENLMQLLTLADKYDTEEVKIKCQEFMGSQLARHYQNFFDHFTSADSLEMYRSCCSYNTSNEKLPLSKGTTDGQSESKAEILDKLSLYMRSCDEYGLSKHREEVKTLLLAMCKGLKDISGCAHYEFLSLTTKVELLECMCGRLN